MENSAQRIWPWTVARSQKLCHRQERKPSRHSWCPVWSWVEVVQKKAVCIPGPPYTQAYQIVCLDFLGSKMETHYAIERGKEENPPDLTGVQVLRSLKILEVLVICYQEWLFCSLKLMKPLLPWLAPLPVAHDPQCPLCLDPTELVLSKWFRNTALNEWDSEPSGAPCQSSQKVQHTTHKWDQPLSKESI